MRNRFLSFLLLGASALGLYAQTEVTVLSDVSSKIQNADFSADEVITQPVCTYDYDMEKNGTTLYGQQAVTGWTAVNLSDNTLVESRTDGLNARAAGVFALLSQDDDPTVAPWLGGTSYVAPYLNAEADEAGVTGPVLGMVAVWGASLQYTQDITLPAGDYMLVVTYYNIGAGTDALLSNNGYVAADGTATMSSLVSYPINVWSNDTVIFRVESEETGKLSLGYKCGNVGSGSAPHVYVERVKLFNIATNYIDKQKIDVAKAELLALIEIGEKYGVDTSASQEVYDNESATLEEVLAAIENQTAINEAGVTDLSAFFIKNPHFSMDDPIEDGITTYDYDMEDPKGANGKVVAHYGMQPVTGWTASHPSTNTVESVNNGRASGVLALGSDAFLGGAAFLPPTAMSDGTTEGKLLGFISVWTAQSQYTQQVSIPAGKYTLEFSYYNVGGTGAVTKNLMGFVADDGTEYLGTTTTFTVGSWLMETIEFELDEPTSGYFSMGYTAANAGSGSMPHLFVDGVSLYYVGTGIDASLFALQAAVTTGTNVLEGDDVFYADLREQLEEAVAAGEELVSSTSSDSEANLAATDAINQLMVSVNASLKAYANLNKFYNDELLPAVEKYDDTTYPELNEQLATMSDDVADALGDGTWTVEQIEETIASLDSIVVDGVKKVFDAAVASGEKLPNDLDITVLFDQMSYTYSTTAVSGANVPDKEWNYGSATNFKTQYGTAEVWNQSPFTVSRTLTGLPAGKYTLTTKAFYRTADNETNFSTFDPEGDPQAFVFADAVKTGLTNVAEIASSDPEAFKNPATIAETMYVPNSQEAANIIFNDEQYVDALQKSVSTVLVADGDLTFGITGNEMQDNCWVVWYGFTLTYNAPDDDALREMLASLSAQAETLQGEVSVVVEADNKINDANAQYENIDNLSTDEMKELVGQFKEAIAYGEKSLELIEDLNYTYTLYTEYLMAYQGRTVESEEPVYSALLEEVGNAVGSLEYESNEQIEGWIDGLKNGFAAYVQYPVLETASEEEPGDITLAIYNSTFSDPITSENNANGWTIAYTGGKEDKSDDVYEFFNNEKFRISQTITGLAEGYYRIRVQSFYRAAANQQAHADSLAIDPEYGKYAALYGQTETDSVAVALKSAFDRQVEDGEVETGAVGVEGEIATTVGENVEFYVPNTRASFHAYADNGIYWNQVDIHLTAGQSLTLGLVKEQYVANDWCPFDNFELYYLGTTAPTAIQGVAAETTNNKANSAIYTITGQRVAKAVKGLYIVNGKKVLVK